MPRKKNRRCRIEATINGVNETIGSVTFVNSVAETDDQWLIDWFKRQGYVVTDIEGAVKEENVEEENVEEENVEEENVEEENVE